jgi:polysaccharide export outer membrane protein
MYYFDTTVTRCRGAWQLWRGIALALTAALGGCGFGGHVYHPSNLPAELAVARSENAQTIDLSKLATYSVSNELIDRGDVLEVSISAGYGNEKVDTMPVRVGEDGIANVPIVGQLPLAGLEMQGAEHAIAAAGVERGLYRNPSVTVTMKKRRTNKITVIGAVEKPGVYELPRGASTLLSAIVAADGLSKEAGTNVEIRRTGQGAVGSPPQPPQDKVAERTHQLTGYTPQGPDLGAPAEAHAQLASYRIDLVAAAKQGDGGQPLSDGDVVMIERRDPKPVHVIGLVTKPGQFELPVNQDLHVLDVIAMAGGLNNNVADKVHVIRHVAGTDQPAVIELSLREAKRSGTGNLRLGPGDVVSVEDTPVTVFVDTIRTFFRVGFSSALPVF